MVFLGIKNTGNQLFVLFKKKMRIVHVSYNTGKLWSLVLLLNLSEFKTQNPLMNKEAMFL